MKISITDPYTGFEKTIEKDREPKSNEEAMMWLYENQTPATASGNIKPAMTQAEAIAKARATETNYPQQKAEYKVGPINVSRKTMENIGGIQKLLQTIFGNEVALPTLGAFAGKTIPVAGQIPGVGSAIGAGAGEYVQESIKAGGGLQDYLPNTEKMKKVGQTAAIAGGSELALFGGGKLLQAIDPFERAASGVGKAMKAAGGKTVDGTKFGEAMLEEARLKGGKMGGEILTQITDEAKKWAGKQIDLPTAWKIAKAADNLARTAGGTLSESTANKATQTLIDQVMRQQIAGVAPEVAQAIAKFGPLYNWFPKGAVAPEIIGMAKKAIPTAVGVGVGGSILGNILGGRSSRYGE